MHHLAPCPDYEYPANTLHQLTIDLVERFDVIAIEDLNVAGMLKNHPLGRAVADMGFGEFRR